MAADGSIGWLTPHPSPLLTLRGRRRSGVLGMHGVKRLRAVPPVLPHRVLRCLRGPPGQVPAVLPADRPAGTRRVRQ